MTKTQAMTDAVREALYPELRSPKWLAWAQQQTNAEDLISHPQAGHCYVASETLWLLLGGTNAGFHLASARDYADQTHWWVEDDDGNVLDPTASQYFDFGRNPPYAAGQRRGPAGPSPSERSLLLIDRVVRWER